MVTKSSKSTKATRPANAAKTVKPASSNPVALVTGASSGIGEVLAQCFARAGHDVILVARSADKLKSLASALEAAHGISALALSADLSVAGAAAALFEVLQAKQRHVDVLVNCAGVLYQGSFLGMDAAKHQQIIDLNISGVTAMLSAFLPDMVARAGVDSPKRVLNVASIAAFQPIPTLASYAASKAYVLSLSESLAEELKGTGVTVTALCPGMTATHMLSAAAGANNKVSRIPSFMVGDVNEVAQAGFDACMKGQAICVPGAINLATTLATRATPKWLVRKVGGLLGRNAL
jgi:uncharacterized protein